LKYNSEVHYRRSIRLRGYDYSQSGLYFVTICIQNHECRLGAIIGENIQLTVGGWIVYQSWFEIPQHFPNVQLDEFVVMPNHIHVIIVINDNNYVRRKEEEGGEEKEGGETPPLRKPTLGQIVAYYKYRTTKIINELDDTQGSRLWQRNYYEHIIRDEKELFATRQYIANNPINWAKDKNNRNHQTYPNNFRL
jgi:putative transposase